MNRRVVLASLGAAVIVGIFVCFRQPKPRATTHRPGAKTTVKRPLGPATIVRPTEVDPSDNARVFGVVTDGAGEPLDGGLLILHCLARGAAASNLIPGGVVRVEADGSFEGPSCLGLVCAEFRHPSRVPLHPWELRGAGPHELAATLLDRSEGRVEGSDGQPIAGARITVRPVPGENLPTAVPPFPSPVTSSDADGEFMFPRLERPPCDACSEANGSCQADEIRDLPVYHSLRISAQAPGYRPAQLDVDLDDTEPWRLVMLPPAPAISGSVTDMQGRPYARVHVLATSEERPSEYHRARAVAGKFEFDGLGEGPHELRAIQDGVELAQQTGIHGGDVVELLGSNEALGVELCLEILDSDANPVVGAQITGGPFVGAVTDHLGEVRALSVLPNTYPVTVRVPSHRERFTVEVTTGSPNRQTFELAAREKR
ncbi:MAG: carboxypeptidase-like regulatory domain-containing protein [Nannocystaceae bacterium]